MRLLLGILLFINGATNAQQYNLVTNPSFEQYSSCPPPGFINLCNPWINPTTSTNSGFLTFYFSGCSSNSCCGVPTNIFGTGYQFARTGIGYASGFMSAGYGGNVRNYIQAQLSKQLDSSKRYFVHFYINLVNRSLYACNNIGLYLSATAPSFMPGQVINVNPQILNFGNSIIKDTLNWVKVSGIFKSTSKERFITIGNFKTDSQTDTSMLGFNPNACDCAQYNIDDVSVIPLDSMCLKADAGLDKNIALGDSVFIGNYTNGIDSLLWLQNGTIKIDSSKPGFFVKPITSTFYVLQQTLNGCFSRDTVYINVNPMPLKFNSFSIILRYEKSAEVIWTTSNEINVSHFNIQRSINGVNYKIISYEKAKNSFLNQYTFIDNQVNISEKQETLYYRIEAIDFDGKKTYSIIKQITIKPKISNKVMVYPNPAKDQITLTSIDKIVEVKMYNSFGQLVKHSHFTNSTNFLIFRIEELREGIYILKTKSKSGSFQSQKLIIQ